MNPSEPALPMTFNKQKSRRYAFANERMKRAMEQGFYLEAITICESLISDRLLSSLDRRHGVERNARAGLHRLINAHLDETLLDRSSQAHGEKLTDIFSALRIWKDKRNELLHGIAKCLPGDEVHSGPVLMERSKVAAEEGLRLFRHLDNWHGRHARRAVGAASPAPNDAKRAA
ncbi:MAG: hypothetical protein P8R46_02245 [Planctomycetota bacterium]|nr:hypothetical protein [Planctomycetota bacterium]